jgi:zinc protease
MAFNGTKNFKKHEIVDYLESIGMKFGPEINAYTSFDETVYQLQLPSDSSDLVKKGFDILKDWAFNISFENEEIDKERGVIIEESRYRGGARKRMLDKQFPVIFKNSKYARRIPIGKEEILETFEYATLRNFYNDWYRPDLMAVIAVGDIDKEKVKGLIEEHFGEVAAVKNSKERTLFEVPDHKEPLFAIATDPEATGTSVSLLYKHDIEEHKTIEDYRSLLIGNLYHYMINARFSELAKEADPPFMFAYSTAYRMVRTKRFYELTAMVKENGLDRGLETLVTEAERIKQHGFTVSELERAKTDFMRAYEKALAEKDKTQSRRYAQECLNHFLNDEPMPGIEYEFEYAKNLLPSIQVDETNKLVNKYIKDENLVVTVSAPDKEGVMVPDQESLLAIFKSVNSAEISPYVDDVSDAPLIAEVPEPVNIINEKNYDDIAATEIILGNGISVLMKQTDFKNDEIRFRGYSTGGSSLVDDEDYMSARAATSILGESGLGEFNSVQLQKKLAGKIVNVSPYIYGLTEGISGSSAVNDVEIMFQLIYLYFTAPRFDAEAYQSYIARMKGYLANRSASPEAAFYDTLSVTMSQHHFRSRPWSLELLEEIDLARAEKIYKDRFSDTDDFKFIFVGNLDLDEIKRLSKIYLGNLPVTDREETWKDVGITTPKGVIEKIVYKGIEDKGKVTMVFTGPYQWSRENNYELNSMLDMLEIKLREVIREDKSGTYNVSVYGGGSLYPKEDYSINISWGCDPARVDELTEAVFEQIDSLKITPPKEIYVIKVRETQIRDYETDIKENGYWLNSFYNSYWYGRNLNYLLSHPDLYEMLTAEMMQSAAQKYFDLDNYVRVVLKPEKSETEKTKL